MPRLLRHLIIALCLLAGMAAASAAPPLVVGSKRFTESYVLGELARQVLADAGVAAEHRPGLGNTAVMEQALASGAIDLYPEYTGTIVRELLHRTDVGGAGAPQPTLEQINRWLAPRGLKAAVPLGFDNGYALAMREADAVARGIATLSDLARAPASLKLGLSHEFLERADGWRALKAAYGLPLVPGSGLDHGLAYQALAQGQVDVIDVYTTDAQIECLKLRVLRDDRAFFPRYDAVLLMRAGVDERPLAAALGGRIDATAMRAMNAQVEIDRRPFDAVARDFLQHRPQSSPAPQGFMARLFAPDLPRLLGQHLLLVFGSLALALAIGIPAGIWVHLRPRWSPPVMAVVGVLQPLPSLALLAFLVAMLGRIGFVPALLALSVYALLPIVRNTQAGLAEVSPGLREAALALGLRRGQVLRHVELPLALPVMLAGIQTAAVLNVGTATVATFVGAGGLGERIVSGMAVNDVALMLAGAVPAAVLALAVQLGFEAVGRRLAGGRRAQ